MWETIQPGIKYEKAQAKALQRMGPFHLPLITVVGQLDRFSLIFTLQIQKLKFWKFSDALLEVYDFVLCVLYFLSFFLFLMSSFFGEEEEGGLNPNNFFLDSLVAKCLLVLMGKLIQRILLYHSPNGPRPP